MNSDCALVIVVVDGLAESYVQPETMPFLSRLAADGRKLALVPSPFFAGAEPALWGSPGERLGLFTGYCFDPARSPYRSLPSLFSLLDWMPKGKLGKLMRTLWARFFLQRIQQEWLPPQLFPANLLRQLASPPELNATGHVVHRVEEQGMKALWYSRDFPFEGMKWAGSQLFALRYGAAFRQWILDSIREAPQLLLFELSVDLDRLGHRYGPRLEGKLAQGATRLDARLEALWKEMPRMHWLVISDHGMSEVTQDWDMISLMRQAGLWKHLRYKVIMNSTLAQFQLTDAELLAEVKSFLEESGQGQVLVPEQYAAFGIPESHHWGNLIFTVPEGRMLLPNHFQGRRKMRGMHGYASSSQLSACPLALFHGAKWRYERLLQVGSMMEVYPEILALFGWEP